MSRREQCGRCGHWSDGCDQCGVWMPFLGASINGQPYCHTWSESTPTCYTLASWDGAWEVGSGTVEITPRDSRFSLDLMRLFYGLPW